MSLTRVIAVDMTAKLDTENLGGLSATQELSAAWRELEMKEVV